MKDKLIHGCFFTAFIALILSLYFMISAFIAWEEHDQEYNRQIEQCNRRIEALRREYKIINSPDLDEFIIMEDINFNYPV